MYSYCYMANARKPYSLRSKIPAAPRTLLITICAVAIVGVGLSAMSRASTPPVSAEVENGNVQGLAAKATVAGASGGYAVKFGVGSQDPCANTASLKFCDDFDGTAGSAPDSSKWHVLTGSSWGGQCFRNAAENIALDGNGNLRQTLINKGSTQCTDSEGYNTSVTSGGMDTQDRVYFKYGTFEIRAKISCAHSMWGAIWTATGTGPGWPQSGEIDIFEQFNDQKDAYKQTIHGGNPHWQKGATYTYSEPLCNAFHVYGVDWRQGSLTFTLDGATVSAFTQADANGQPWPFDTYDQRLIIDLQYGSPGWPSAGTPNLAELPSSMLIDYVRVFK